MPVVVGSGGHLRIDVLAQTSLDRIGVLGHVARSAAAGSDDRLLQGRRLEIRGRQLRRLGGALHIAGAAATMGTKT